MKTKKHVRQPESAGALSGMSESLESVLVWGLTRCEELQETVHAAFGGELFLPDEPPTSPRNRQRFNVYLEMVQSITKLKFNLIHEFMNVNAVDSSDPHQMCNLDSAIDALTKLQSRGQECVQKKTNSAKRSH